MDRKKLEALVWRHRHRDFGGRGDDGVRRVLHLNPRTGGTELWPLSSFTDRGLIAKLPRKIREGIAGR
jgi:hypothetical protein